MDEAHVHARRVLDAICAGGAVDDDGIPEAITAAVLSTYPEANGADALAAHPMVLAAIDPADGHPWVAMSVLIHSATGLLQVVAAWELAEVHPEMRPDFDDVIWFTVSQPAIEPHLGVSVLLDGPAQYPTWMAGLIGDQVVGDRQWGDHLLIGHDPVADPVETVLDMLAAQAHAGRPAATAAPDDADTFDPLHQLVAAAVDANHPGAVDPEAGVAMAAASLRWDRSGLYLIAGLFVIDDHGRTSQAHLAVDLAPWSDHPMVVSANPAPYHRALLGGRTGIVACGVDEFPTWSTEAASEAA